MEGRHVLGPYTGLWIFAVAFGLMEAVVVVYIREILDMQSGILFPFPQHPDLSRNWILQIEAYRELATLLAIVPPAYLFGNRLFERFLAFGIIFGLWDLSYYGFLWVILDWPPSLFTYDVLFLWPRMWVAPVICPVTISLSLVLFGTAYLLIARRRKPRNPGMVQMLMSIAGGGLVIWSFVIDADYYLAGGMPPRFSWIIFVSGFFIAAISGGYFLGQYIQQSKTRFM